MKRNTLALLLVTSLFLPSAALADERNETRAQIEKAQKEIDELKRNLQQIQQQKSTAEQNLKRTESELGTLEKQVESLEGEQKKNLEQLNSFTDEKKKLDHARSQQEKLIAMQARAAYQSGTQEPLRLLLNQQRPEQLSRNLTYYQYISQARLEQIQSFKQTLANIADLEAQISAKQAELSQQKEQLASKQAELGKLRQARRQQIAQLNTQQRQGSNKLSIREKDQQELNRVLQNIEKTLALQEQERKQRLAEQQRLAQQQQPSTGQQPTTAPNAPSTSTTTSHTVNGLRFDQAKGKLPWPINGKLAARFGSARGDARSKWDGVLIAAPVGHNVQAIHSGKVVFADWLRGAGLLVIIDHGGGYLSLYGYNQTLLSKVGDSVTAGQTIATVGNSGGQSESALYFAIRQQGRATDPAHWCRSQG